MVFNVLNFKVTLISNLELYGIDIIKFSKECQHGVAASTTINDIPNAMNRQVQIQGSQVNFVYNLLIGEYLLKMLKIIYYFQGIMFYDLHINIIQLNQ